MIRRLLNLSLVTSAAPFLFAGNSASPEWSDIAEADLTLMGDYVGEWSNPPARSYMDINPQLCARVVNVDVGEYDIYFVQDLDRRADHYFDGHATLQEGELAVNEGGWNFKVTKDGLVGEGQISGKSSAFSLKRVERVSHTMGKKVPKGAVVLFDGTSFDAWEHTDGREVTWTLLGDGSMEINPKAKNRGAKPAIGGPIRTKQTFKDCTFHMEFRYPVEAGKSGQGRGNSGLFFQSDFEVQILNSYGLDGNWNELGALYKFAPPKVNAARPPLQWQTYDVKYKAPRFNKEGKLVKNPFITVWLNGVLVHSNEEIFHHTAHKAIDRAKPMPQEAGPIQLQDHSNRIQFRNIWIKEDKVKTKKEKK